MRIDATGWSRNAGTTVICNSDITEAKVYDASQSEEGKWNKPVVSIHNDIVRIIWGTKVRLSGDYRIDIDISNEELCFLMRQAFGEVITEDVLECFGMTISDDVLGKEIGKKTFKEVVDLL